MIHVQGHAAGLVRRQRGCRTPPARPPGLLPERCQPTGETGDQHGIHPRDVDTELEGVGAGKPTQLPVEDLDDDEA